MSGSYQTIDTDDGSFQAWVTTPAAGSGPGLILLQEIFGLNEFMRQTAARFAEEGYVCMVPDLFWRIEPGTALPYAEADEARARRAQFDVKRGLADIGRTVAALRAHASQRGKVGVVGYCMGGMLAARAAALLDGDQALDCGVSYYGTNLDSCLSDLAAISCPFTFHFGDEDTLVPAEVTAAVAEQTASQSNIAVFGYPECGHAFASPSRETFNKAATMIAYSRTLDVLRRELGPIYDLTMLWDKHTEYEFATRDVDATMATMVDQPYVNHVPTMTGGVGHDHLKRFYKYHFVNSNPPDTRLIPVSRTVGTDRLVDEMIFCFTHTCEIPWMLPGIEPTGQYVEIPLIAVVNFRGDKLYHEHIYWDQASVLVQIGVLDPSGLPVAGIETARKLLDETLPSNELMAETWETSADKPL